MSKLISISGLDGSGKSTQIELLKDFLEKQGKSFYYFHAVEFSVGNKLLKRPTCHSRGSGNLEKPLDPRFHGDDNRESVTKANWLQIQLRKIALFIDIFRFKRLLKKLKVDYIISDRYFYDSVVNIKYLSWCHSREGGNPENTKTGSRIKCGMTKWIEKFIPKPDFAFYLKVDPEKIMQRERKPDQGMEYLVAKNELFADKIKDWDMIAVDGAKEKEEIFNEIREKCQNFL